MAEQAVLRKPLGWSASAFFSLYHRRSIRIFFDALWLRRDGNTVVALEPELWGLPSAAKSWKPNAADKVDQVGDWWFLHYRVKPGDVVLDIGAGMGEDTLLFSRMVGDNGAVFSFEAHPDTFRGLQKVVEYSGARNAELMNAAIFSKAGTLEIETRDSEKWQENSVMLAGAGTGARRVSIPGIALDEFEPLQRLSRIDFLKMNIEGAEVDALEGMKETLKKVQHACIACHDFLAQGNPRMETKEKCRQILEKAGFQIFEMPPNVPPWQRDHLHAVLKH
jgi:FkbM family methyltransferase